MAQFGWKITLRRYPDSRSFQTSIDCFDSHGAYFYRSVAAYEVKNMAEHVASILQDAKRFHAEKTKEESDKAANELKSL